MAPLSVKKSYHQFFRLQRKLQDRLDELGIKRQCLSAQMSEPCSPINDSITARVARGRNASLLLVDEEAMKLEIYRLTAQVTDTLIEILTIKLTYIDECVGKLAELARANPRQETPLTLRLSHFDDWIQTNQQLYQLNSQLYDLQKQKRRLEKQRRSYLEQQDGELGEEAGADRVNNSAFHLSQTISTFSLHLSQQVQLYIVDRLSPQHSRITVEARKIHEFVTECEQFQGGCLESPPKDEQGYIRGAHPQSYQEFMAVFCSYINERHKLTQLEELDQHKIYMTVEHHLMPKIKHFAMRYVRQHEKDVRIHEQCLRFADVTLGQLHVDEKLRGKELFPFADAIAHMRATYFSQNPTDKMFSVMAAAKALYEKLDGLTVDGDLFMDIWVYVCIKAKLKNMATDMMFMAEYGNPHLSSDEAGYYLTTLNCAMNFIEHLAPEKLQKQEENDTLFVVCECQRAKELASLPGNSFEILSDGKLELTGYRAAVVRDWVLDTSRFFRSVLVPSINPEDKIIASLLRLTSNHSTPQHVELCHKKLTESGMAGVNCELLPEGRALQANPELCPDGQLIFLPSGNVDEHLPLLSRTLQLIRLGSNVKESPSEETAVVRSLSYAQPGSPGNHVEATLTDAFGTLKDETELDMLANMVPPKRTRSRLSLPVRKSKQVKYQPLLPSIASPDSIQPNRPSVKPEVITVTAEVHEEEGPGSPTVMNSASEVSQSQESMPPFRTFPGSPGPLDGSLNEEKATSPEALEESHSLSNQTSLGPSKESDFFSPEYIARLEENFCNNHFYGNTSMSIDESIHQRVKLTQIWLQRLNHLSNIHGSSGVYDDMTVKAVQRFQAAHNRHDTFSSLKLPETGILSFATFQYLKQQLLTIFSNMMRLRRDTGHHFMSTFDHMSTDAKDVTRFRKLVSESQEIIGVTDCKHGVLCSRTVAHIRRLLKSNSLLLQSRNELALTL